MAVKFDESKLSRSGRDALADLLENYEPIESGKTPDAEKWFADVFTAKVEQAARLLMCGRELDRVREDLLWRERHLMSGAPTSPGEHELSLALVNQAVDAAGEAWRQAISLAQREQEASQAGAEAAKFGRANSLVTRLIGAG